MNFLKKLAFAAALAVVGTTSALAAVPAGGIFGTDEGWIDQNNLIADTGAPGVSKLTWTLDNSGGLTSGAETGATGDTFVDVYLINIPDAQYTKFNFVSTLADDFEVSFQGYQILAGDWTDLDVNVLSSVDLNDTNTISSGVYSLPSGVYGIAVFGTYEEAGGMYNGKVITTPVPEPTGLALMLAGLGAIGALARRRRKTQA